MGLSENEAAPLQKPANRPKERSRPLQSAYTRKVYFIGDQNFYIKGVTYGAFAPGEDGIEFHDFAAMAAQDINTVRIPHTLLPTSLLDKAYRHGLRVIGGLSAEQLSDISRDREKGVFRDSAVVRFLSRK